MVKNLPANAAGTGLIPDLERSPGEEMATHSSILAWKIPWAEEPNGLQSMGLQRVRHDLATKTIAILQFTLMANARIRIPFYFRPLLSLDVLLVSASQDQAPKARSLSQSLLALFMNEICSQLHRSLLKGS